MKRIKVLQAVGSLGIGGTEIFVINFFRFINKERFQIDFIIFDDAKVDFMEEVKNAGSRVYICKTNTMNKFLRLCSETYQTQKILKRSHYDIVHCHGNSFRELFRAIIPGRFIKNTKVIAHSHNPGEPKHTFVDDCLRNMLKRITCRSIDVGCACSDLAAQAKYTNKFIQSSRFVLVNNAINAETYKFSQSTRNDVRRELNIQDKDFVLGHVGRISYEKNHSYLIDIFYKFHRKQPNAKLLMVGDGQLRTEIEKKVKDYNLEPFVIFAGKCEDAFKYYNAMDCFVLPSLFEGFPFVLVEAQINGLRCIVSDNISRMVNISGGVTFCSNHAEPQKWADLISSFGRKRLEKEQINIVIRNYDLQHEVKKIEELYGNLYKEYISRNC